MQSITIDSKVDDRSGGEWLWSRVESVPEALKEKLLQQAGLSKLGSSLSQRHQVEEDEWAFASLPSLDSMFEAVQQGRESPFLRRLQASRTFNSPDCAVSMAEAYRIGRLLEGLKGSSSVNDGASEEALEQLRDSLKLGIKAAWSQEAVRRGVAAAKSGDTESAHKCYARALELDSRNVDAWVARGAAHANDRSFHQAAQDFETALELKPDHANAAKYLETTKQRMAQLGMQLLPRATRTPSQTADLEREGASGATQPPSADCAHHGSHFQAHRNDEEKMTMDGTERHHSAVQGGSQPAPAASSQEHSSDSEDKEEMDLQKALKIVTEHYSRRNAQLPVMHSFSRGLIIEQMQIPAAASMHPLHFPAYL
ncbi:probable tetratricopeptide repeat protein 14 [Coccomyxa sp. Obi]|nr:probable tetratricopeptide repeat protein 14 [Coccomyxa sp. Obi]